MLRMACFGTHCERFHFLTLRIRGTERVSFILKLRRRRQYAQIRWPLVKDEASENPNKLLTYPCEAREKEKQRECCTEPSFMGLISSSDMLEKECECWNGPLWAGSIRFSLFLLLHFLFRICLMLFGIAVQQEQSASRPQECIRRSISISTRGGGKGTSSCLGMWGFYGIHRREMHALGTSVLIKLKCHCLKNSNGYFTLYLYPDVKWAWPNPEDF